MEELHGINIGDKDFRLSHFFYGNDAIFFGEWSRENILNLIGIL